MQQLCKSNSLFSLGFVVVAAYFHCCFSDFLKQFCKVYILYHLWPLRSLFSQLSDQLMFGQRFPSTSDPLAEGLCVYIGACFQHLAQAVCSPALALISGFCRSSRSAVGQSYGLLRSFMSAHTHLSMYMDFQISRN